MLKSSNKSEIAVLKVELRANEKGYHVSLPRNQSSAYDLIIDSNKQLLRAQIKYLNRQTTNKQGLELLINNQPKNKKRKFYTKDEIDILLCFCPKINQILCFYPKDFHNKKTIWINLINKTAPTYYKKFLW